MNVTQGTPTQRIARDAEDYPSPLRTRLGANAPEVLVVLGDRRLLRSRRTALFCSARTPGDAILRAHDVARRMRDEGVTVISGFHSPIEKECLRILLRGKQPVIVCPARTSSRTTAPPMSHNRLRLGVFREFKRQQQVSEAPGLSAP